MKNSLFQPGEKVETTQSYFKQFGRKVYGEVVDTGAPPIAGITPVRWTHQEGNAIAAHQNQVVLMVARDLQKTSLH